MPNPALKSIRKIERKYDIERAKRSEARNLNQNAVLTLLKLDHDENRESLRTARDELRGVERNIDRLEENKNIMVEKWDSMFGGKNSYDSSSNDVNQSSSGEKVFKDNLDKYNHPEYGLISEAEKERKTLTKSIRGIQADITSGSKLTNALEYISYKGGSNPDLYDSGDFTSEKISKETGVSQELVSKYIQSNPILFGETRLEQLNTKLLQIDYSTSRQEDEINKNLSANRKKNVAQRISNSQLAGVINSQLSMMTPDMSEKDKTAIKNNVSSQDVLNLLIPENYISRDPNMTSDEFNIARRDARFNFGYDWWKVSESFKTANPNWAGFNLILRRIENNVSNLDAGQQNLAKKSIQESLGLNMDEIEKLYHPDYRRDFFKYEDMFIGYWKKENLKNKSNVSWGSWFKKNQGKIGKALNMEFPLMSKVNFLNQEYIKGLTAEQQGLMYSKYLKTSKIQFNQKMNDIKTILDKKR